MVSHIEYLGLGQPEMIRKTAEILNPGQITYIPNCSIEKYRKGGLRLDLLVECDTSDKITRVAQTPSNNLRRYESGIADIIDYNQVEIVAELPIGKSILAVNKISPEADLLVCITHE